MKGKLHPKFQRSIELMLSDFGLKHQFFGEFALNINFIEETNIPTAGVNTTFNGFNCYWNPNFLDKLSQEEVNYLLIHEIEHLLLDHQTRTKTGGYDHTLSNVAQDMIINRIIDTETPVSFAKFIKGGQQLPGEYNGNLYFEELYVWLENQKKKYDNWKNQNGQGQEQSQGQGNSPCPVSKQLKEVFDSMDSNQGQSIDIHLTDEVSKEVKESMVKDLVQALKSRGLITANIESILGKLTNKRKDYLKDIVKAVAELKSYGKQRTYMKNRKSRFGSKGKTSIGVGLNVILDVSGSMFGYFEKALNTIYKDGIMINLIQADTEVKSHTETTSKRDIQKIKINGGGGTELQPAVDYVIGHKKLSKMPTCILTDGYTDSLDVSGFNKGLILTVETEVPIKKGNIKQIVITE